MKMSYTAFRTLYDALKQAQNEASLTREDYNDDLRYRWDLLWYSTAKILPPQFVNDLYRLEDLNDSHIDTALRKIINDLQPAVN